MTLEGINLKKQKQQTFDEFPWISVFSINYIKFYNLKWIMLLISNGS